MSEKTQAERAEQRIAAYIDMLKAAYQVDEYGLADLLGINRATWTRNRNARFDDMTGAYLVNIAQATGISLAWLFVEAE